ncbi:hypothetical protein [Thalassomonas actiniarum]|uniref:Lipoprotein n=1 Tax=Thalassomonas actiniarum TaxID=485447 RepID=A0AAE9YX22_9GAMM|nr:hypothetical protein [Thalassomonas actiniarum]WDE02463.1 hypothetical protein SG35_029070 [Thalassomonas actiniarum]
MKFAVFILYFFAMHVFACGELTEKAFLPFAVEIENGAGKNMKTYEVYFPVKDIKETDFFLNGITSYVPELFQIELYYLETDRYIGDYYSAMLTLNKSLIDKALIVGGYNALNKEKTSLVFCGNFKRFELTSLLENKRPNLREVALPKPLIL